VTVNRCDLPGELIEQLPQTFDGHQQPSGKFIGLLLQPVTCRIVALEMAGKLVERGELYFGGVWSA
jgi:hypothetical protein